MSALALAAVGGSPAQAEDLPRQRPSERATSAFGASARVQRPLAATQREDPTAAGTEIDTTRRDAAEESVSDVLLEVPGARPFRTGSLGTFTTASLRGAEVEHTAVLLGEIPLSSADASAFDLSILPLSIAERVVVYRGGAPLWLSQGAIGGIIQIVPQSVRGTSFDTTLSAGSFSTYALRSEAALTLGRAGQTRVRTLAGVLGSRGDFPIAFDNKTSFDTRDDFELRRRNADFAQAHGLLSVSQTLGPGNLELLLLGFERTGGEPGSPADPVLKARRQELRGLSGLAYSVERPGSDGRPELRLSVLGSLGLSRARFSDLAAEVDTGGASTRENRSLRAFGRVAASIGLTQFLQVTALATATHDAYSPHEALVRVPMPDSGRTSLAAGAEAELHGRLLGRGFQLRPSVRLEHSQARLHSERFGDVVQTDDQSLLATYRVGAALELLPDLSLSASAASGARTPSMLELFGDGALLRGNTALRPEHSRSFDVGLSDVTCSGDFSGSFELRVFDLSIEDQVLFVRNAFSQLLPLNLAHSHVRGLEAGARTQLGAFFLNAAATFLDTEGKPGKRLPNRPRATFFVQPGYEAKHWGPLERLRVFAEVSYVASSFDDPDNQTAPKPPNLFLDAGATTWLWQERVALRLTVRDVFDHGGQDLRHFPLPGRAAMLSLTYHEDLR
jgi:vitamin B12 transporter